MAKEKFYAGQLNNLEDLDFVSSGGASWALIQHILNLAGVVYGAVQEHVDYVYHKRIDNIEEAKELRRSKYFQSLMGDCYKQAREDLQGDRYVLFTGTGCQIAGLIAFLGKEYNNLLTCEVVCHGVPSMKAWEFFRREHESTVGKQMTGLVFRDKSKGWSHNQYKITYSDGSIFKEESTKHLFHSGYLQGLFYRPSCGGCKFASMPRIADITLADYWAYKGALFVNTRDLGISLIVTNTQKGNSLLLDCERFLTLEETSREFALCSCRHLNEHPCANKNRSKFMMSLFEDGYVKAARKYFDKGNGFSVVRRICRKVKTVMKGNQYGYK